MKLFIAQCNRQLHYTKFGSKSGLIPPRLCYKYGLFLHIIWVIWSCYNCSLVHSLFIRQCNTLTNTFYLDGSVLIDKRVFSVLLLLFFSLSRSCDFAEQLEWLLSRIFITSPLFSFMLIFSYRFFPL